MCTLGGLEVRVGKHWASGGEGRCASWEGGEPRELLEGGVCAVHIFTSAGCSFLSSPSVSCKVHIIVRLFPDLFVPVEDKSCFQNSGLAERTARRAPPARGPGKHWFRKQTVHP